MSLTERLIQQLIRHSETESAVKNRCTRVLRTRTGSRWMASLFVIAEMLS